ncbi:MAG: polymer-forming cytoskeletal protein [Deltaproteobacteria bacterium]|nr:polymer-forming cytoskeletal protein [Deltaproteobacteria bacterium]MBW1862735.1 polymer-forming cytoskeletal protein [Deltaproteobacteria bacterium]
MKKKEQVVTFLGKGTEFEGKLTFDGTIRIDGHFKGEISSDGNLIVGEGGMVEANMHVAYIVISGEVHGNIIADQKVEIRAPGRVFGDIQAPTVVIDEGVIFEGKTKMYQAKESDEKNLEFVGSDESTGGSPSTLGTIYGLVMDSYAGEPVKNAEVRCKGAGKKATKTDASGYYELTNLEDGKWKMEIRAKGYKKNKATVEISGGGKYEQNFE